MTHTKEPVSLASISRTDITFAIVAMDQRNTLKRMYQAVEAPAPSEQDLVGIKADVVFRLHRRPRALARDDRPDQAARRAYLADEGLRRLDKCSEAIVGRARPWNEGI